VRVLTFLSDFGRASQYPAAMKAVAAAICEAAFVDISHDVPPLAVRGGAYLLWSVAPIFPPGTVHCAVVDPGVGTTRAALAVASGGQFFVGPDNGLLVPAARRCGVPTVYRLTDPAYWRTPVSATFHGRDVFAPVAAHLASGVPLEALGEPAARYVDLTLPVGRWDGTCLRGEVLWIDPFGNLVTTIPGGSIEHLTGTRAVVVETESGALQAAVARTFGDVARGAAAVLVGSDGMVEVAVNSGSAAARTGASVGGRVHIRPA
jgi:S-adenosylmethionine hydrolase